jgi:hypothetical protein
MLNSRLGRLALAACVVLGLSGTVEAQPAAKPNIVVIMGDDIGGFNVGAYQQGITAGRTPNLWRFVFVQQEGAKLAQTAIDFPPMQQGASFNLAAVKAQIDQAIAAHAGK